MSNFGSRQLGFFTSKGSSTPPYQNLQQTLDFGNVVTTTNLQFTQAIPSNQVKFEKDSFLVVDGSYQVISQSNYTSVTKVVGSGEFTQLSTSNNNINMGSVNIGNTILFLDQPNLKVDMILPRFNGTMGIRSMLFQNVDLSSGDIVIGDSISGTDVSFNKIFYVTNGSNSYSIVLDAGGTIADNVPFYICFANTDGLQVNIVTSNGSDIEPYDGGANLPYTGNGFLTFVKINGIFWCNGVI